MRAITLHSLHLSTQAVTFACGHTQMQKTALNQNSFMEFINCDCNGYTEKLSGIAVRPLQEASGSKNVLNFLLRREDSVTCRANGTCKLGVRNTLLSDVDVLFHLLSKRVHDLPHKVTADSKTAKAKAAQSLEPRISCHTLLLPYSVVQSKSQGQLDSMT